MSLAQFIVTGSSLPAGFSRQQIGGKADRLMCLRELDIHVPPFYVITTEAFKATLRSNSLDRKMRHLQRQIGNTPPDRLAIKARHLRQAILDATFPESLRQSIQQAHEETFSPTTPCAVRSSGQMEDDSRHSFAGIYDTYLQIAGWPAIEIAIKQVWASALSEKVIAYCWRHRLQLAETSLAVIVQQLVAARHSGLMFTHDPVHASDATVVIQICRGLGQALADGQTIGRCYRVDRGTGMPQLAPLPERHDGDRCLPIPDDHGHPSDTSVPPATPCLEDIQNAAAAGLQIEQYFGAPQDIEFCWDDTGRLCLLQARPITTAKPAHATGNRLIWDNSNIVESYSGVTLPMTFSFIRRAYSIVYHCFAEVMGISPRQVHQHQDAFDNMLGLFRGRVYYNLKNWYRLVSLFPGYSYNRQFMEAMMGVKEPLVDDTTPAHPGFLRRWFIELPALIGLLVRSTWNFYRIEHLVRQFDRHFEGCYGSWSQINFENMPPHEILANYRRMERTMLWNWKTPIINDFYVMVCYGVLRKMCESWCGDRAGTLQNGLLCGDGQLESAAPADRVVHLAQMAEQSPELRSAILQQSLDQLPSFIAAQPEFAEFSAAFDEFLNLYGLRCVDELKLESRSYRDEPEQVYRLIRSYLQLEQLGCLDTESRRNTERAVRQESEHQAMGLLRTTQSWLPRQALFRRVLEGTRRGIRNRERMRMARTRIYGVLRSMLRALGRHFQQAAVLDSAEDIFYLTIDEVWDFIRGTAVTTELRDLVRVRQAEYDRYRTEPDLIPGNRFETSGVAYLNNSFQQQSPSECNVSDPVQLQGIGCCPGIIEDDVQVVRDPKQTSRFTGGILVAERTDPGWVPIYPAFRGILVERGSVLSHSAIVAREFGIPTIVAINGLTQTLRSGQRVRMNGQTGRIEVIETVDSSTSRPRESVVPTADSDIVLALERAETRSTP